MTTALITHRACLEHGVPPGYDETPDRLRAILHALEDERFALLLREQAPLATLDDIALVHEIKMIDAVMAAIPAVGAADVYGAIDNETFVMSGSREAALRAAGAVMRGVDLVMSGDARNVFCAVRPPGHHSGRGYAMGFCLFNNVAIGAAHARKRHGLERVAIIDFDVHHGNGTQDIAQGDAGLFYVSSHQFPFYPSTGDPRDHGRLGNILNLALPRGAGSAEFRAAYAHQAFPALARFAPELIMISAGFDAHARDPLGQLRLGESDFDWVTGELMKIAERSAAGRIVSTLEGGYDLHALAMSTAAHVAALMG